MVGSVFGFGDSGFKFLRPVLIFSIQDSSLWLQAGGQACKRASRQGHASGRAGRQAGRQAGP